MITFMNRNNDFTKFIKTIHHSIFFITYLSFILFFLPVISAHATETENLSYAEQAEIRKTLPIQSNDIMDWPAGPEIGAESAILMDVNTGVILYAKNIHEELYPASTTKIMTCLLAMENGNLDDMVDFSYNAVFSVPRDGSNIGMDPGQAITLEQCMYGIMVGSANECANAAAEYVSGSIDDFIDLMNNRAKDLGCTNTHFCNTNGLFDENHYTSAYDLALISKEFFKNEMLCKIGNTPRYHFIPTAKQPDEFYINNKHKLINGEIEYEGVIGGKTGYTSEARETLVTCAEQNGMKLVCVVFKEESPDQFYDTVTLFNYGFSNFHVANVSDNETRYTIRNDNFFQIGNDVFGDSNPFLSLDTTSYVILPHNRDFTNLNSKITYNTNSNKDDPSIATIQYYYDDTYVGSAKILLSNQTGSIFKFNQIESSNQFTSHTRVDEDSEEPTILFINVKWIIISVSIIASLLIVIICIISFFKDYHFSGARRTIKRRKRKNITFDSNLFR